jgi:RNA polymerase sigma-70 factor (ECF subfamily)
MTTPADTDPVELLTRHRERIRRLIDRMVAPDDAADVEQEVYVAALERPPRNAAALPSWIATTVRNLVAKSWRGRVRRRARETAAARPEPQPATADLVARVELEEFLLRCVRELAEPEREVVLLRFFEGLSAGEVAARLRIGASTERARTARALAQLRERLDARCAGDRSQWIAALAPPLVVGASVMSAKVVVAAGVALALMVGGVGWKLVRGPTSARGGMHAATTIDAASAAGTTAVAPETAAASGDARRTEEKPKASPPVPLVATVSTGELKFRVVDAQTGQSLEKVAVRALNDARCVDWKGDREADLVMAAGAWDVAIFADGLEPEVRSAVVLRADAVTDLGTVALGRGSAVLRGTLRRGSVAPDARAFVELRGDGRSPCPRCKAPFVAHDENGEVAQFPASTCCGYFWDRSFLEIGADGRFEFGGLAAGTYFLRPMDATPRVQPTLRVTLARGEWRRVELDLEEEATLTLTLLDEHGAPFVGQWKGDGSDEPDPIHFNIDVDGVVLDCDGGTDPDALRAALGAPPRLDETRRRAEDGAAAQAEAARRAELVVRTQDEFLTALAASVEATRTSTFQRSDRERKPGDTLLPEPPTPGFGWLEIGMAQLASDVYLVMHLAASRVKVSAKCGRLSAETVEADLANPARRAVTLVFR